MNFFILLIFAVIIYSILHYMIDLSRNIITCDISDMGKIRMITKLKESITNLENYKKDKNQQLKSEVTRLEKQVIMYNDMIKGKRQIEDYYCYDGYTEVSLNIIIFLILILLKKNIKNNILNNVITIIIPMHMVIMNISIYKYVNNDNRLKKFITNFILLVISNLTLVYVYLTLKN